MPLNALLRQSRFILIVLNAILLISSSWADALKPIACSYDEPLSLPPIYPTDEASLSLRRMTPSSYPGDCKFWIVLTDREARERLGPREGRLGAATARRLSGLGSSVGLSLTVGAYLLGGGRDRRNAAKALDAVLQANLLTGLLKGLASRERPYQSNGQSRFHGPLRHYDSFPSGHTTTAFALATVLGERYPEQEWLYNSLAALVGWSRIRKDCHFLSDVIAGAAIGRQAGIQTLR